MTKYFSDNTDLLPNFVQLSNQILTNSFKLLLLLLFDIITKQWIVMPGVVFLIVVPTANFEQEILNGNES